MSHNSNQRRVKCSHSNRVLMNTFMCSWETKKKKKTVWPKWISSHARKSRESLCTRGFQKPYLVMRTAVSWWEGWASSSTFWVCCHRQKLRSVVAALKLMTGPSWKATNNSVKGKGFRPVCRPHLPEFTVYQSAFLQARTSNISLALSFN